jgi:hypothetical protein
MKIVSICIYSSSSTPNAQVQAVSSVAYGSSLTERLGGGPGKERDESILHSSNMFDGVYSTILANSHSYFYPTCAPK